MKSKSKKKGAERAPWVVEFSFLPVLLCVVTLDPLKALTLLIKQTYYHESAQKSITIFAFWGVRQAIRMPQFPYQRKYAESYEKGNDAVYPPGQVSAKEEDVDKRCNGGAEKYRTPDQCLFSAFLCQRLHDAKERVIEKRPAGQVDYQEDDWIDAVIINCLLYYPIDFRYDEFYQGKLTPVIFPHLRQVCLNQGPTPISRKV